jgi:hypothetical protein
LYAGDNLPLLFVIQLAPFEVGAKAYIINKRMIIMIKVEKRLEYYGGHWYIVTKVHANGRTQVSRKRVS